MRPQCRADPCDLRHRQPDGLQFLRPAKDVGNGIIAEYFSGVHHQNGFRILRHVLHAVGNQHNGGTRLPAVLCDLPQNFLPPPRIQSGSRLVQNQNLRPHRHNAGNCHPALLSAGQEKRRLLQYCRRQSGDDRRLPHPCLYLFLRKSHVPWAESDVPGDGLLEDLVLRILEHQSHPKAYLPYFFLVRPDVLAVQQNRSLRGAEQSVQMLDQRGLSGAGVPDESHKCTGRNLQIHMVNGDFFKWRSRTVAVGQPLCL